MYTLSENFENLEEEIPHFDKPKEERNLSKEKFSQENKVQNTFWLIEIQDYKKYEALFKELKNTPENKKDEILFKAFTELRKEFHENKFHENKKDITLDDLHKFQFLVTKFKDDPRTWKEWNNSKEKNNGEASEEAVRKSQRIILNAALRLSVKTKVNDVISDLFISEEDVSNADEFKRKELEIRERVKNSPEMDTRAYESCKENLWYADKSIMGYNEFNTFYDSIRKTEQLYRSDYDADRSGESSPTDNNRMELRFNHLLRVQRIAMGIVNKFRFENLAGFPESDKAGFKKLQKDPKELLKLSLIALLHDLSEEEKTDNPKEFVKDIALNYFEEKDAEEIATEVAASVNRLNSYNYKYPDTDKRDYGIYTKGKIDHQNPAKNIPPLTLYERIVKISDIFHNFQTHPNLENEEKMQAYADFVGKNIHLVKMIPQRLLQKIFYEKKKDKEGKDIYVEKLKTLRKNYSGWQEVYQLIEKHPTAEKEAPLQ